MAAKIARKSVLKEAEAILDAYYPSTKQAVEGLYRAWSGHPQMQAAINGLNIGSMSPGQFITEAIKAFETVTPNITKTFVRNGVRSGELFANMFGLNMDINAELWANQFAGQRIASLRDTSIRSVRQYITRSLETGAPLNNLSRDIKSVVLLDDKWSTAAVNKHNALIARSGARRSVQRNQSAYVDRMARIKAEQIARTELAIAANHGKYQSLYAARAAGLLDDTDLMVWIAAPDCCDTCAVYEGMTASLDGGFNTGTGATFPPLHPNCRCTFGIK
jgi:hypothetical protein